MHDDVAARKSQLALVQAKMRQCESFITLCERIKQLEQMEASSVLQERMQRLEQQSLEVQTLMQIGLADVQFMEATSGTSDRTIGNYEQEELKERIKTGKARLRTLQNNLDDSREQIKRLAKQLEHNAVLLQELYLQLDQCMQQDLHPNTVTAKLAELREQQSVLEDILKKELAAKAQASKKADALSAARQAAVPLGANSAGPDSAQPGASKDELSAAFAGQPADESEFYERFIADLKLAQKSVVIVSPLLADDGAARVMAVLGELAAKGLNVVIHTRPEGAGGGQLSAQSQRIVAAAHAMRLTVVLKDGMQSNAAIIDDAVSWEGGVNIMGPSNPQQSMRRNVNRANIRHLRRFLENA